MITSTHNVRIRHLLSLLKKKDRKAKEQFIIDGNRCVLAALKSGVKIVDAFYCPGEGNNQYEKEILEQIHKFKLPLFKVSKNIFEKISYGNLKSGFVCIAKNKEPDISNLQIREKNPFYVVLENLEKPGNIGAVLRTADSLKCSGVFLCDAKIDLYNPNIIRASQGGCFTTPYYRAESFDLKNHFKKNEIKCVVLSPDGKNNYLDIDYTSPVAVLAGNEHLGVHHTWISDKDVQTVHIPMQGAVDSLNVSVAVTVILFEIFRQRRSKNVSLSI